MQAVLQRKRDSRRGNSEEGDEQGTRTDAVRYVQYGRVGRGSRGCGDEGGTRERAPQPLKISDPQCGQIEMGQ